MEGQNKGAVSILSTNYLVNTICEGRKNGERFCFILGAGASVSSNIPSGAHLEYIWMEEMNESPGFADVGAVANSLKENGLIDHEFKEIVQVWKKAKKAGRTSLSSEYYFDIYTLRFYPNFRNGYRYLEGEMEHAQPGFGYYSLALMLEEEGGSNLVITTNFDSLVEDALLLYTEKKPLVINHELLAEFAGELNNKRPVIAKLHRGLFFDPLNRPEETKKLNGAWDDVLKKIFDNYTPIVIGYGGGDSSLMGILEEESVVMKNGLYWCYMDEYGLPDEKIQNIVRAKKGSLVRIGGFDVLMLAIGKVIFPDKIAEKGNMDFGALRFNSRIRYLEESYDKTVQETEERQATEYYRQGKDYIDQGLYKEAAERYTKAIAIQPEKIIFYHARSYAYLNCGKCKEAIADCNKMIEMKSDYEAAYNNRGVAYLYLNQFDKAYADLNQALVYSPNFANPYKNLGLVWKAKGNLPKAEECLTKAIERDPKYKVAYKKRAEVYRALGEHSKAAADEEAASKL